MSVTDEEGDYNVSPAKFTLVVNERPANTPPEVAVGGVEESAEYEHGSVPTATCNVTDAEDTDASTTPSLSAVSGSHATLGIGEQTATCSYTDSKGEAAIASVRYSIVDTAAPVLTVPGDISVEADGSDGSVVTWEVSATDAVDPDPVLDCTGGTSGDVFPLGTTTISCAAEDAVGNITSSDFSITIVDETKPTLTLPDDIAAEATGPGGAVVGYDVTAHDHVDGDITPYCAPASGLTFALGATTVECSAADAAGNPTQGSFDLTVVDTTAPELDLPERQTAEATGAGGAVVEFDASASDLVDGDVDVSCTPASGATFALGSTPVGCSATDGAGNSAHGSFTLTVADNTAPDLRLPVDITAEAENPDGAEVSFETSASDVVDGPVAVSCDPVSGSVFALGETTVECDATDVAGNETTGSFTVTVRDTTAPALFVPTEDVVAEATGPDGTEVAYEVSASDSVDRDVDVVCAPTSESTFAIGTTAVDCTATDDAGNPTSDTFDVVVEDTTGPDITVTELKATEAVGPEGAPVAYDASATDLVDGNVTVSCAPASGSTFPLGDTDVTCTADDSRGNHGDLTFTVTVEDTTVPTLALPSEVVQEATGPDGARVDFAAQVSAFDLVDGPVAVSCDPESGALFALGGTTVECDASDTRDNTAYASFPVRVVDTTAPELSLPSGLTVEATGPNGATVDFTASATDLVDEDVEVDCTLPSGTRFALGSHRVECSATDGAGNTAKASFMVLVADTTAPELTLPDDITVEASGPDGATGMWETSADDLVDGAVDVTCTPESGSTLALGSHGVDCEATDAAGNTAQGSFTVTVQDTTAPELSVPDAISTTATSADGATVTYAVSAEDLVDGGVPVYCTPASGSTFGPGSTTVSCTWRTRPAMHRRRSST